MTPADWRRDRVAILGLALGAVFGMAGTFVSKPVVRQEFWLIDGIGLVIASALLSVRYLRKGCDAIAAGFSVFAIGESLLIASTAAGLEGGISMYGAGVALWAAGLLLVSTPLEFVAWVRFVGLMSAVLFGVVAVRIFHGEGLTAISRPLPYFAYPFLVATFVGWILELVKTPGVSPPAS